MRVIEGEENYVLEHGTGLCLVHQLAFVRQCGESIGMPGVQQGQARQ